MYKNEVLAFFAFKINQLILEKKLFFFCSKSNHKLRLKSVCVHLYMYYSFRYSRQLYNVVVVFFFR